jgi:hypothetical protein
MTQKIHRLFGKGSYGRNRNCGYMHLFLSYNLKSQGNTDITSIIFIVIRILKIIRDADPYGGKIQYIKKLNQSGF